jgi:hypothetical protein
MKPLLALAVSLIFPGVAVAAAAPSAGVSASPRAVYVNYSPDARHSLNKDDSRIAIDKQSQAYIYGNVFEQARDCSSQRTPCLALGSMALAKPPAGFKPGDQVRAGDYAFKAIKERDLCLLGRCIRVVHVEVELHKQHTNYFLYDETLGVVAIGVPSEAANIGHLAFILASDAGVFSTIAPEPAPATPVQPSAADESTGS